MPQPEHHASDWRVKLVLHYDGRNFYGWQAQSNRRTVQGELSAVLERLCGGSRVLTAAGRTDRGVHATGQVASALIPPRFEERGLQRALNALAPPDLWIVSAERVALGFHPRYDAISRTYIYRIGIDAGCHSPFREPWCWPLGQALDIEALNEASRPLVGEHDFSAFSKSGQPERGVRCHVLNVAWRRSAADSGILEFEISADRFLHRMVRYLVRTLAEIAHGRRPADEVARLLNGDPGLTVAAPAPAQGLFLSRVDYSSDSSQRGRIRPRR